MSATNFYMGSLRYSPCGRKRKNHVLTSAKKNKPEFKPMKQEFSQLDAMRAEQEKQYTSVMENYMKTGNYPKSNTHKKESPIYTGTLVKGIATMHKSNAVPVISQQEAEDISNMRRN